MTTHEPNRPEPAMKRFFASHEIKGEPRPEETEEDLLAWAAQEITADKTMLNLLAEL